MNPIAPVLQISSFRPPSPTGLESAGPVATARQRQPWSRSNNSRVTVTILSSVAWTLLWNAHHSRGFQVQSCSKRRSRPPLLVPPLRSSVGDGPPSPPPSSGDGGDNKWDDFLDPNKKESENLQRAREFASENSLPISFDHKDDTDADVTQKDEDSASSDESSAAATPEADVSALVAAGQGGSLFQAPSKEAVANNPYMAVVSKISPSELIAKFTATAHPRVQNAVRSTVLGLIGGLPKLAFDTTTITTGQRLASLMFQLQMTGYMFKNAEYRLSLSQSLGVSPEHPSSSLLLTGNDVDEEDEEHKDKVLKGKPRGKIRIHYRNPLSDDGGDEDSSADAESPSVDENDPNSMELEVDAESYMSELRNEVSQLRDELMTTRKEKEEALRKDLLLYIRTLPEKELRELTNTMSPEVLVAMKGLVQAVISGIGEDKIGPETVTEQSGEAMAQLCMWQLSIGYNLRTLEVREEMKKSLSGGFETSSSADGDTAPGAFE